MNQDLKDLVDLKNKYDDINDKYLLALADIDNMRKNYNKKLYYMQEHQYEYLFTELLTVLDDIDRTIASGDVTSDGILITLNSVYKILSKYGLKEFIPEKNTDFDADKMEAISVVNFGPEYSNKVVECSLKGYIYNQKIIRFPKVIVGK